jgi:murein DD-endopeptidase MepM/ murein hydrolase activator NlpD
MTQQPDATRTQNLWGQRSWLRRLSYLGGVGILSGGAAMAQASSSAPLVIISAPATSQSAPSATFSTFVEQRAVTSSAALLMPPQSVPELSASNRDQVDGQSTENAAISPSDSYKAPSAIVITNRSSGCEITLNQGQAIAGGACGTQPQVTASTTTARYGGATGGSYEAVQMSVAPTTERSSSRLEASVTSAAIAAPAYSFVKDYYNRTVRPLGRLGNGNLRLMFPLSIPSAITSVFGWRIHPITGDARFHSGTDLGAPMGTPVLAALAGRVVFADFFGGYGLAIALEHDNGKQQTLYGHLSEIFVKPGEIVKQGAAIGRVGSTGNSTGPHLHFEFRQLTTEGWVAQDPGVQLEDAMAQLVKSLQTAQKPPVQPGAVNAKS